jgi:hypothetical protein
LGNVASVLGLILSGVAAIYAQQASSAAEAARNAVLARTMEHEISAGLKLAAELAALVGSRKYELALGKCADLADYPSLIRVRWTDSLSTESKNNWLLAHQQVDSIHVVLGKAVAAGLTRKDIEQLNKACLSVRTIFVVEQAEAMRDADKR